MTLRHIRIFLKVCECDSVTEAAEKLGIAQPAVSLAIKELEDYYGVLLFDRISRRLYLTEDGKALLKYARQITFLFEEMENNIKNWDSLQLLRVGSSITIGTCLIPDYVKRFHSAYPKIKVNVTIDNSSVIEKKILRNELDFAFIEGITHSENILSYHFLEDRLVLVCGANHDLSGQSNISLDELSHQTLILREKGSGTRQLFDSTLLTHGITVTPAWESISTEAIIHAVASGIGVSVLPYRLVEHDLAEHRLQIVKIKNVEFKRFFNLIYHKDKHLSKSALEFLKICQIKISKTALDEK